jgi:3-methyladenine DNA glycosylase/8-oxoguanine DNA glycosylase
MDTTERTPVLDGGFAALCRIVAAMDNAAMLTWNIQDAAAHLADADPRFAEIIETIGPCGLKIHPVTRPFPSLLHAIVYQQLSGKAAATIWGRVAALFPRRNPTPDGLLGLTDEQLRAAGMSRGKILAARDLAAKVLDGTVPKLAQLKKMDDDEIMTRLTQVRGIGPWSAEMFLMFRLGRPDVLPVGDLAIRKGFQIGWKKRKSPEPQALAKYGRRWAPYRTAASWYLWAIVDQDGGGW